MAGISNKSSFAYRINNYNSIFSAETLAICQALDDLVESNSLSFDIFELQEPKLPVRLNNTTNERRLVKGHGTIPPKVKGDIEDVSSELDNGGKGCPSLG
ncbi:hypothetical protein TNCV_435741 [Trichonephila clavipes]|nr:hypothetical protein TNCV_435741 [Trichonephila clavipes]